MLEPYLIEGELGHISHVLGRIRKSDWEESYALTGKDPDDELIESWLASPFRWSIIYKRRIVGVMGLLPVSTLGPYASPWLVATEEIESAGVAFTRKARALVRDMLNYYPVLFNVVDCRNKKSIRWLELIGFKMRYCFKIGPFDQNFLYFDMKRDGFIIKRGENV